ncbi:Pentatricopeptide repeat-containing protein, partial [Durusdinium trenchii]
EASAEYEQKELTRKEAAPGVGNLPGPEISAPVAAQVNPGEYKVILDKSTGARLGIDVDHKDGETLLIEVINEGLVQDWNLANKEKVHVGDRIIEVNGIAKDVLQLVDECKKNQVLTLKLRRA